jgi:hypothetical protein
VETDDPRHRHGKERPGVVRLEILGGDEGKALEIVKASDPIRRHVGLCQPLPVERRSLESMADGPLQPRQLDGGQLLLGLECGHEASVHGVTFYFFQIEFLIHHFIHFIACPLANSPTPFSQ